MTISKNVDMINGSLTKNIIKFSIPVILTNILQLFFNAADLVIVGQYCGEDYVGAVGATLSVIHLIIGLFIGLSVGVGVAVAQGLGARDDKFVSDTVHTSVLAFFIVGVILTGAGIAITPEILAWMKTPGDILPLAITYMQIYFAGTIVILLYNCGASILRAAGDSRSPLIYLFLAGILNVGLNLLFVMELDMDVDGVAWASTISQAVSCVLVLGTIAKRKDACKLKFKKLRIKARPLKEVARIGLPAGIQGTLFSISNVIIQSSINGFGELAVAGNSAAISIEDFSLMSMDGVNQAAVNFSGQNFGAKKFDRIKKLTRICIILVTIVGVVTGGAIFIFAKPLLAIYTPESQEAIDFGFIRLAYVCLPYFVWGMMMVMTGVIRGLGASFVPMLISVLGICGFRLVYLFTVFQIPEFHTPEALFFSYPVSWAITLASLVIAYKVLYGKILKKAQAEIQT